MSAEENTNIEEEDAELLLDSSVQQETVSGKIEKNQFIQVLDLPATEYRLQEVFGVNPKTWNELKDKGILPRKGTNREVLVSLFNHYRQKNDAYLKKVELNGERGSSRVTKGDQGDDFAQVLKAEKLQKIRLDKAREEEIFLKNSVSRGKYIDKTLMNELLAPVIGNIASILRNASDENPDLSETIDKCFKNLFALGEKIVEQAEEDREGYVQEMISRDIDLEKIIEESGLEFGDDF